MPTIKKTTAKPAAKKTAAMKTATKLSAKKATVAKATVKKTATKPAVKPAVKKAATKLVAKKTTAKPAVKTVVEISVNGNKKIGTLQKEFNKKFPYIRLGIFYSYARQQVAKGESITPIPENKTLASVRRVDSGGDISISGNKKIKSLEKEFDTVFGLYAQVCYTNALGIRYYTSGSADEMTLSAFNEQCQKNGCKKGIYR